MNYELRSKAITVGDCLVQKSLIQKYKYGGKAVLKTENFTAGDCCWQHHVIKQLALIYVFINPVVLSRLISKTYFVKFQV